MGRRGAVHEAPASTGMFLHHITRGTRVLPVGEEHLEGVQVVAG
jgi:hypothetical protein